MCLSSKMFDPTRSLPAAIQILVLGVLLIVAVWFVLYRLFGHIFTDIEYPPEEHTITRAKAGVGVERRAKLMETPYLPNTFPGGRQVSTVYGTIQVFEWGPEQGEKVLLVHGLGTPCIALGDMAKEFVSKSYRVMIFGESHIDLPCNSRCISDCLTLTHNSISDLFGRGYSDTPNDLSHDARLYTTQILLVLSSSTLPWTGSSTFHIVGFSLGGSITVAFAAHHAHMLRSATLVCPGGLIRMSHISRSSRFLYSSRLIPDWLRLKLIRHSLAPAKRSSRLAEVPCEAGAGCMVYNDVSIAADRPRVRIGDVIQWQLDENPGSILSYLSTMRSALVIDGTTDFGEH
jgi:pimeloyl-ACP methyl ester carboxylesterase